MGLEIHVATAADLDASSGRIRAVLDRRLPEQRGQVLLGCRDGVAVGVVFIFWGPADEPEVRQQLPGVPLIFHLYVVEQYRRQGIGRTLVRSAEERLRARGYTRVVLGVDQSNDAAQRLYRWLGYAPALRGLGARADPYDIWVADLLRAPPCRE